MGSWQLEVIRMTSYIVFPVAMFHYFNRPGNFEKWVLKARDEKIPACVNDNIREYEELVETYNRRTEKKRLEALEKVYGKVN